MALALNGERFKEMDVDAVLYPAIHQGRAKIVVAVKDYLIRTVYLGLQLEGTLDRVVYDEAHKYVRTEVIDHTSPNRKMCSRRHVYNGKGSACVAGRHWQIDGYIESTYHHRVLEPFVCIFRDCVSTVERHSRKEDRERKTGALGAQPVSESYDEGAESFITIDLSDS